MTASRLFSGRSAPVTRAILKELEKGNHVLLVGLLWGIVGLALWGSAFKRAQSFWRFGKLNFQLESMPGSGGGNDGGVTSIRRGARLMGDVILKLRHLRISRSGSRSNRRSSESWWCASETLGKKRRLGPKICDPKCRFFSMRPRGTVALQTRKIPVTE